jgi:HSP20 family molecular chaperone IbpA
LKISTVRVLGGFERACDELFDELLGRWRSKPLGADVLAVKVDRGDRYEVRVEAAVSDPRAIEVEVSVSHLVVRIPPGARPGAHHTITFAHRVDSDRTTARWSEGALTVTLPKQPGRRVKVQ